MKKLLCVISVLFATEVYAETESMIKLTIEMIMRRNSQFEYAIETKDYNSACSHSRILESELADLGAGVEGDFRETVKEQGRKQHVVSEYVCSISQ